MEILIASISVLVLFFLNSYLTKKLGDQKIFIRSKMIITICLLIYLGYSAFTNDSGKQIFFCLILVTILVGGMVAKK